MGTRVRRKEQEQGEVILLVVVLFILRAVRKESAREI